MAAAEFIAGLGAIKTAFDLAKGLKDIDDATRRNAAIIELQEKILTAQATQSELVETVGQLKARVAELESWEAESQRYELTEIRPGLVCFTVKETMRGGEPPHRLCANCYASGKKRFLQQHFAGPYFDAYKCHECGEQLQNDKGSPPQKPDNDPWGLGINRNL